MTTPTTPELTGDELSIAVLMAKGATWEPSDYQPFTVKWLRLHGVVGAVRYDDRGLRVHDGYRYATSIAAAAELMEEMQAGGYWCKLVTPIVPGAAHPIKQHLYWIGLLPHGVTDNRPDIQASGTTAPEAICCAYLAYKAHLATLPQDGLRPHP